MHITRSWVLGIVASGLCLAAAGCMLGPDEMDPQLLYEYQRWVVANSPAPRINDLEPLAGLGAPLSPVVDPDTGARYVELSLPEAIRRGLAHNVDIRVVAFDPAIARQRIVEAQAVFDWVVFANASHEKIDRQSATAFDDKVDTTTVDAGLRKIFWQTGGQLETSYTFTKRDVDNPTVIFNPSYFQSLSTRLTQPLLRNAGTDFTLAQVRIARVNYRISIAQFRARVLDTITEIQTLYWQLVRARQELEIQERLLNSSITTLEQVEGRLGLDATNVQLSQAQAAVATRRAALIRARKVIFDIQDRLIRTINDPSLTLLQDVVIVPATPPSRVDLTLDPADQIAAALRYSPELEQARLAIRANDIQVAVARDQLLPRLDLTAGVGTSGLNRDWEESLETVFELDYIDLSVGLAFEYPLGNRSAEAQLRRNRYERYQSIVTLQNTADQVAVAVLEAIRQIRATRDEIEANSIAVERSRDNLTAINERQEFVGALTPEFLQVRLGAQESLAAAERAQLQSVVDFNIAQANLARVTGTALPIAGVIIADAVCPSDAAAERVQLPVPGPAQPILPPPLPGTETLTPARPGGEGNGIPTMTGPDELPEPGARQ